MLILLGLLLYKVALFGWDITVGRHQRNVQARAQATADSIQAEALRAQGERDRADSILRVGARSRYARVADVDLLFAVTHASGAVDTTAAQREYSARSARAAQRAKADAERRERARLAQERAAQRPWGDAEAQGRGASAYTAGFVQARDYDLAAEFGTTSVDVICQRVAADFQAWARPYAERGCYDGLVARLSRR